MGQTWFQALRGRIAGAWDVLTGRAYAAYSVPDYSDEIAMRAAGMHFVGEFDAFWHERNVKFPDAEAWSYLRGARDRFAKLIGI